MVLVVSFVGCHFAAPTCPKALAPPKDGWPNGDGTEVCPKGPALGCWPKPAAGAAAPNGDAVGAPNAGAPNAGALPNEGAEAPKEMAEPLKGAGV